MNDLSVKETERVSMESFMKAFDKRYPTVYDCVRELRSIAVGVYDLACECGSQNFESEDDRKICCLNCGKTTWILADTFFHGIRRPREWLALLLMLASGAFVNTSQFQQAVGIAYSSAQGMFKKLTLVLATYMGEGRELPSHLFAGAFCKRSKRTPAGEHPRAEEEFLGDGDIDQPAPPADQDQVEEISDTAGGLDEASLSPEELEVLDLLAPEPIHFDQLCERSELSVSALLSSLTLLELAGYARRLSSDRYALQVPRRRRLDAAVPHLRNRHHDPPSTDVLELATAIVDWIKGRFHGISRKYLQNYLAAYWCSRDRATWNAAALAQACLEADAISDQAILGYVTPPLVRVIV